MESKKIGAIIPVRLASERLPSKAIRDLVGKPVICHLLDRAFDCKYIDKKNVVVCTTEESSDDPLVKVVEDYGASIFRGSTDDLIKRFYDAINHYKFDYVVQIDGDDVTVEPIYMDLTMEKLMSDDTLDCVSSIDLPLGVNVKSFSTNAMQKVFDRYQTKDNDTGFASFFTETDFCKHTTVEPVSPDHIYDTVRLTLDYQEDFNCFEAIFKELYQEGEVFHIEEIVELLRNKPEIAEMNWYLQEEYMKRWHEKRQFLYTGADGEDKRI